MKLTARLGALGRQIRGWLPMEAAVATATLNDRKRLFMSLAGIFFVLVGGLYVPPVVGTAGWLFFYVIRGPLGQALCPPNAPCALIDLYVALTAPVLLVATGELLVAFGLYFRPVRHRRTVKSAIAAGGAFAALVGTYFLSYVPSIPASEYTCTSTGCVPNMTSVTPFVLIFFGVALLAFGILYKRRHSAN